MTIPPKVTDSDTADKVAESPKSASSPFIVCDNLVKIYKVADLEVVALQGLELTVNRGEMLGIVGASGSGKSTLMNILGGLDRPTAGKVTVDGQDLLKLSDTEINHYRRTKVGFVWQQTGRNLIPYLSAQENVEVPMTLGWMNDREKHEWSSELLQAVGLYERRNHSLVQLSGGEQQRVSIAVALANKPVLLLGDEPTGEVDSVTAQKVMAAFRTLREKFNLTILIVTHDPRIAELVDRVVAIRDGKTSTETIRQVQQLEHAMIGEHPTEESVTFHEYVVLDGAGRLQIPREYLDTLNIGDRAFVEMEGDRIVVRPVEGRQGQDIRKMSLDDQLAALFAQETLPEKKSRRSHIKRRSK
jgi:putative ABC transport system ATP-binding protein